jgi:class 3 adenylate cyclase/pimeloyl-ACP methyl ester carboxylesterase
LFVRGWISHLEGQWLVPAFRRFIETLARQFTVIRFDARGQGLSDLDPQGIDLDALVVDVETIVGELDLKKAVVYGQCYGGPVAIAYAARHPESVERLILDGTYARGSDIMSGTRRDSFLQTLESLWPDSRSLLAHLTNPDRDLKSEPALSGEAVNAAMPASVVRRLYEIGFTVDVSELTSGLQMPVLVMHRRASRAVPFVLGRTLAGGIPGASFVTLDGSAHNPWEGDAHQVVAALGQFLGVDLWMPRRPPADEFRGPVAILFTDIEGSTALTSDLGDARAQALVHTHDDVVRSALADQEGREVRHTGDGVMAYFASVSAAVGCAIEIQRELDRRDAGFRVRIGLHAGEPLWEGDEPQGTVVQTARRVVEEAAAGEILVSDVVRTLVAGKEFPFSDRGASNLKGLREPVRLFRLEWRPSAAGS